jgi:hypothetical protein
MTGGARRGAGRAVARTGWSSVSDREGNRAGSGGGMRERNGMWCRGSRWWWWP